MKRLSRSLIIVLFALLPATSALFPPGAAAQIASDVPPAVLALVPAGGQAFTTAPGDYMHTGQAMWAVLYTVPGSVHVLIAGFDGSQWTARGDFSYQNAHDAFIGGATVRSVPAIELWAPTGDSAERLMLIRWDGSQFAQIFDGLSNVAQFSIQDMDGTGTPQIIAKNPAGCLSANDPLLPSVFVFDGGSYQSQTGAYPELLSATDAQLRTALDRASAAGDGAGQQCLSDARQTVAHAVGGWSQVASWTADQINGAAIVPSPQYPLDRRILRLQTNGVVQTSSDAGASWQGTAQNVTCTGSPSLVISPTFANDQTVAALGPCTAGAGPAAAVLLSHDGGKTWAGVSAPGAAGGVAGSGVVFSPTYSDDHRLWVIGGTEIDASDDGGATWAALPPAPGSLFAATGSGSTTNTLFASAPSHYGRSVDFGLTWQDVGRVLPASDLPGGAPLQFITGPDPRYLYTNRLHDVWASSDGGVSWNSGATGSVVGETAMGCGVGRTGVDVLLVCAQGSQVGFAAPSSIIATFANTTDPYQREVLVQTSDGLWQYKFFK